ncbi:response regulator [Ornithinibacillus californiensis]|uniref:response regulator n=1 Tax=Ornithinibacillus californiensis TaxID=161536 RepID=UPI00064DB319|nr:response regulator [Ornithinibacillus californiensis]
MIKAVLVDDEILALDLLNKVLSERQDIQIIAMFTDPEEALVEIPILQPNVLFLDVDLPVLNGIELGTRLIELDGNDNMSIVFVTAYEQYAIHAFKLNAIHYILKPVTPHSVDEVMSRIHLKRGVEEKASSDGGEICLFGPMHLKVNGGKVDFLTAKMEELLALLIMHREKGISKWRIIDVLWEDSTPDKSQQNLYTMIFRLKKKLKSAGVNAKIIYKNSMYTMDLKEVYCDIVEFDQLMEQELSVSEQNIAEFEKIISLYKGDLLEEKDYLWCVHDREKYYQHFVDVLMSMVNYYVKGNQRNRLEKLYHHAQPILIEEDYSLLKSVNPI